MQAPCGVRAAILPTVARMLTGIARYDSPTDAASALETLSADIAMARRRRSLSMEEAAKLAGLSRDTWARLERGDAGVSLGTLASALESLGMLGLLAQAADPGRDRIGVELERERLAGRARVLPRRR